MSNEAGNISYTHRVFLVLLLWKSVSPPCSPRPSCYLITPKCILHPTVYLIHCVMAMRMSIFPTRLQVRSRVYFIPVSAAQSTDALTSCVKWTGQQVPEPLVLHWGVSSGHIGTTEKWCHFPRDSSANIINSNWAQTRRKTKTEQGWSSSHCVWSISSWIFPTSHMTKRPL